MDDFDIAQSKIRDGEQHHTTDVFRELAEILVAAFVDANHLKGARLRRLLTRAAVLVLAIMLSGLPSACKDSSAPTIIVVVNCERA